MKSNLTANIRNLLFIVLVVASCKSGEEGSIKVVSRDQLYWSRANDLAAFPPRIVAAVVHHDDRMWIMGGIDQADALLNDVWYSEDGITWNQVGSGSFFTPRFSHKIVSFEGDMYLIGGKDGTSSVNRLNDVWHSSDGANWSNIGNFAPTGREGHQVLVFNNRIWAIGGIDSADVVQKDVRWSINGSLWNSEPDLPFTPREYATAFVYNSQMWYAGGYDSSTDTKYLDTWYTSDGSSWLQGPDHHPDLKGKVTVYNEKLYVIGGRDKTGTFYNEAWKGFGNGQWKQLNNAPFSPREPYTLIFRDKLWVIGGETFESPKYVGLNDIWYAR